MKRFTSLEEAKINLTKRLEELTKTFCPLTNKLCNFNCVCFKHPHLYDKSFSVFLGGCNNKMFKGYSEPENFIGLS